MSHESGTHSIQDHLFAGMTEIARQHAASAPLEAAERAQVIQHLDTILEQLNFEQGEIDPRQLGRAINYLHDDAVAQIEDGTARIHDTIRTLTNSAAQLQEQEGQPARYQDPVHEAVRASLEYALDVIKRRQKDQERSMFRQLVDSAIERRTGTGETAHEITPGERRAFLKQVRRPGAARDALQAAAAEGTFLQHQHIARKLAKLSGSGTGRNRPTREQTIQAQVLWEELHQLAAATTVLTGQEPNEQTQGLQLDAYTRIEAQAEQIRQAVEARIDQTVVRLDIQSLVARAMGSAAFGTKEARRAAVIAAYSNGVFDTLLAGIGDETSNSSSRTIMNSAETLRPVLMQHLRERYGVGNDERTVKAAEPPLTIEGYQTLAQTQALSLEQLGLLYDLTAEARFCKTMPERDAIVLQSLIQHAQNLLKRLEAPWSNEKDLYGVLFNLRKPDLQIERINGAELNQPLMRQTLSHVEHELTRRAEMFLKGMIDARTANPDPAEQQEELLELFRILYLALEKRSDDLYPSTINALKQARDTCGALSRALEQEIKKHEEKKTQQRIRNAEQDHLQSIVERDSLITPEQRATHERFISLQSELSSQIPVLVEHIVELAPALSLEQVRRNIRLTAVLEQLLPAYYMTREQLTPDDPRLPGTVTRMEQLAHHIQQDTEPPECAMIRQLLTPPGESPLERELAIRDFVHAEMQRRADQSIPPIGPREASLYEALLLTSHGLELVYLNDTLMDSLGLTTIIDDADTAVRNRAGGESGNELISLALNSVNTIRYLDEQKADLFGRLTMTLSRCGIRREKDPYSRGSIFVPTTSDLDSATRETYEISHGMGSYLRTQGLEVLDRVAGYEQAAELQLESDRQQRSIAKIRSRLDTCTSIQDAIALANELKYALYDQQKHRQKIITAAARCHQNDPRPATDDDIKTKVRVLEAIPTGLNRHRIDLEPHIKETQKKIAQALAEIQIQRAAIQDNAKQNIFQKIRGFRGLFTRHAAAEAQPVVDITTQFYEGWGKKPGFMEYCLESDDGMLAALSGGDYQCLPDPLEILTRKPPAFSAVGSGADDILRQKQEYLEQLNAALMQYQADLLANTRAAMTRAIDQITNTAIMAETRSTTARESLKATALTRSYLSQREKKVETTTPAAASTAAERPLDPTETPQLALLHSIWQAGLTRALTIEQCEQVLNTRFQPSLTGIDAVRHTEIYTARGDYRWLASAIDTINKNGLDPLSNLTVPGELTNGTVVNIVRREIARQIGVVLEAHYARILQGLSDDRRGLVDMRRMIEQQFTWGEQPEPIKTILSKWLAAADAKINELTPAASIRSQDRNARGDAPLEIEPLQRNDLRLRGLMNIAERTVRCIIDQIPAETPDRMAAVLRLQAVLEQLTVAYCTQSHKRWHSTINLNSSAVDLVQMTEMLNRKDQIPLTEFSDISGMCTANEETNTANLHAFMQKIGAKREAGQLGSDEASLYLGILLTLNTLGFTHIEPSAIGPLHLAESLRQDIHTLYAKEADPISAATEALNKGVKIVDSTGLVVLAANLSARARSAADEYAVVHRDEIAESILRALHVGRVKSPANAVYAPLNETKGSAESYDGMSMSALDAPNAQFDRERNTWGNDLQKRVQNAVKSASSSKVSLNQDTSVSI